ncbi:hypothetical protein D9619_001681 [Psilocybe cf. subviscida]|uniref:Uncharacterized protein n=1 Tax=Psilocybe cf. subviscida TaxID=2480587 RepID=A0A8H5F2P3_9AGAR|nr:hypothetical protein D9619_001681 [Psilocybe cf. subviscida]
MTTNKLKLKRTPEEEVQHKLRKEKRREKKRKRREAEYAGSSSKRVHLESPNRGDRATYSERKWASSDDDGSEYGPQPAPSGSTSTSTAPGKEPNYDALKAEIEERMFREKMFEAMGEDERLDGVEMHLNDFVHVPDRWKAPSTSSGKTHHVFEGDDFLKLDPSTMDEEEYVEWIRAGMYRKTHAEEYAEQQRKKAAKEARKAEEKARKAEASRLEKILEEERQLKKLERDSRKLDYAREDYNTRWAALLAPPPVPASELKFDDIPWPIASANYEKAPKRKDHAERPRRSITLEDLTADSITSFLLPVSLSADRGDDDTAKKKDRKDRLREAFLRFHPDKFEGRFMKRIMGDEQEKVREAIGQVSRVLNSLMGEGG